MSLTLKPGVRVYSAVGGTELIVVKAPPEPVELTIGGVPAALTPEERSDALPVEGHDGGVAMGKRYSDPAGTVELLVTKPGTAVPAVGGELLEPKGAKKLPPSD